MANDHSQLHSLPFTGPLASFNYFGYGFWSTPTDDDTQNRQKKKKKKEEIIRHSLYFAFNPQVWRAKIQNVYIHEKKKLGAAINLIQST